MKCLLFGSGCGKKALLFLSLLLIISQHIQAQVINNNGARLNLTSGVYVTSGDAENKVGGVLSNNGNLNLSGNYLNNGTTSGNGIFRLGGNWTNTSVFNPGNSTVIFNGSGNQTISRAGGETFFNLGLMNSGASTSKYLILANDVTVQGTLDMSLGIINGGSNLLYLSNPLATALFYHSITGSRILGKFERGISQQALYLFPLGTTSNYNPANLTINSIVTGGSVLSQFFSAVPGNNGLPLSDPPVEIADAFSSGYWRFTPNSFSASNFNINLDAAGFTDTVRDVTRLIKRVYGGNWIVDGTHADAVGTVVSRNNLTGDLDPAGTEFAPGRARPLITVPPVSLVQCEHTNAVFTVTATGATPFKYQWYKDGSPISNGADYSGARTATLTVIDINLSDDGNYYCIVTDKYRNSTTSTSASLTVMKIPVATLTNSNQPHECSTLPIANIVFGLSYYDPGTTFIWTRDNPTGISSVTIPMGGTFINIGDFISGSFDNLSNAPQTITFTVTPKGPGPTFCTGLPVTATVTVNPHPIASPLNNLPAICDNTSTSIVLKPGSTMTQGVIEYDFTVTTSGGSVGGSIAPGNTLPNNYTIARPYTNSSDTIQSVYFHITPKNTISGCPIGATVDQEVKVHAYTIQGLTIVKPLTCDGGSDASVRVTTSKGASAYFVNWQGPNPLSGYGLTYRTGLRKGRYDIDVTDNLGCPSFNTDYIVISGAKLDPVIDVATKPLPSPGYQTSCWYSSDGEITIFEDTPSTGVAPFTYSIIYNSTDTISKGSIPGINIPLNFTGLKPGSYMLHTIDKNGCSGKTTADIVPPDTIRISFTKKPHNGYDVSCKGYNDGAIKASVTGGNGIYTYKWTTPDGSFVGPDNLDSLASVSAGTYYLTITDQVACTFTKSVTVIEPAGMVLQTAATKLSYTPDSAYNIACSGGNTGFIDITVTGGTLPYTYFWTDSASYTATTQDISNLKAATYVCKVTDRNGCVLKMPPLSLLPSFGLTEPPPMAISSTVPTFAGGFNISCHGGNNGSITVSASGGSGGTYIYNWSTLNGSGIVAGSNTQNTLKAGTYHLDVADMYGCHALKDFTLTDPPQLSVSLVPTHITCVAPLWDNGSIDLTVTGGVAPYTYLWSNGAIIEDISGLTEGNYSVTVTDANGCTASGYTNVNKPPDVNYKKKVSLYNGFNVSCNSYDNGYIKITPTSGTAPFTYAWSTGAVTDSIGKLTAGPYTVTITDALQCKASEIITLSQPGELTASIELSNSITDGFNIDCAGSKTGSISVTPVNAVVSANYIWSDGSTSQNRTGLGAGDYTLIMTDANFCHTQRTITLAEPDSLKLSISDSKPWCPAKPDGALSAVVSGGVIGTGYTYKWSDNSTGSNITGLLPGDYSVAVTDRNNCIISKSIELKPQNETCLVIPNAISPNGDLINDQWNIGEIDLYPNVVITIFNRWGESLWRSDRGYHNPWDGTSNGNPLPIDSYHYIIDLHNGEKPIIGTVTIVR